MQLPRGMLPHPMVPPGMQHFPPPPTGWPTPGLDPYRDPYRLEAMHSLRYVLFSVKEFG